MNIGAPRGYGACPGHTRLRAKEATVHEVDTVRSRGMVVFEDDAFHGRKGHGGFVRRGLSQYLV